MCLHASTKTLYGALVALTLLACARRVQAGTAAARHGAPRGCSAVGLCERCAPGDLNADSCARTGRRQELVCDDADASARVVTYLECAMTAEDETWGMVRFEVSMLFVGLLRKRGAPCQTAERRSKLSLYLVQRRKLQSTSLYDKRFKRDRADSKCDSACI
ncbi:hypothetical protein M885DRAFT_559074 [Pelagophyceae sp. CCMP2097]|nr:hypothetical protein M885DRAFT_559074 [Pelagophyceae sp. CCMP2097]